MTVLEDRFVEWGEAHEVSFDHLDIGQTSTLSVALFVYQTEPDGSRLLQVGEVVWAGEYQRWLTSSSL